MAVEITSIKMESEQIIRKIRNDSTLSAEAINTKVNAQKQIAAGRVTTLTDKVNAEIADLDACFEDSSRLLVNAYEKYLSEMDEASRFLPITVTVTIPSRKITLKAISIRPTDTLKEFKVKVEERMRALGDPLCDLGEKTQFYLIPLFGGVNDDDVSVDAEKKKKEEEKRDGKKEKEKEKKEEKKEGKKEKEKEKEKEERERRREGGGGGRILLQEGVAIILSSNPPPPQGPFPFLFLFFSFFLSFCISNRFLFFFLFQLSKI